jgi:hypothetical protein
VCHQGSTTLLRSETRGLHGIVLGVEGELEERSEIGARHQHYRIVVTHHATNGKCRAPAGEVGKKDPDTSRESRSAEIRFAPFTAETRVRHGLEQVPGSRDLLDCADQPFCK